MAACAAERMPGLPLFPLPHGAEVGDRVQADLAAARMAWLEESKDKEAAEKSDFPLPIDHEGHRLDFHAFRHS